MQSYSYDIPSSTMEVGIEFVGIDLRQIHSYTPRLWIAVKAVANWPCITIQTCLRSTEFIPDTSHMYIRCTGTAIVPSILQTCLLCLLDIYRSNGQYGRENLKGERVHVHQYTRHIFTVPVLVKPAMDQCHASIAFG